MTRTKKKSQIIKQRAKKEKKSIISRIFRWFLILTILMIILGSLAGLGGYYYISENLPKISSLKDYRPPVITTLYSDDNRKIAEFFKERRIVIPLEQMPKMLIEAFISAEDSRFYEHQGIDFISILRAFVKNFQAGTIVQGGSTITQQVTKSFFLSPERSYTRKIKEAILSYRIDKYFSKNDILYLYLNQIYLGHGAYGVEAAAENYFGKSVQELNLAECAMLAGLPQAPSKYSPFKHLDRAKERQIYVLTRMVDEGYITQVQSAEAMTTMLDIQPRRNWYIEEVPFYTEHVRRYIEDKYGKKALYEQGLQIYTAGNIEMQKTAREEIEKGLRDLDKRQGYRGPVKHLKPEEFESYSEEIQKSLEKTPLTENTIVKGIVIDINDDDKKAHIRIGKTYGTIDLQDMRWARKPDPEVAYYESRLYRISDALSVGDVVLVKGKKLDEETGQWELALEQTPLAEAALLCFEAETGEVKAMIGGRNFQRTQFNRAFQSRRQPGSAFKPIIYAAALDKGYTAASIIIDSPIVYENSSNDFTWKPRNYEEKFYGPTLFRDALAESRNIVTIKILSSIGIDYTIAYARKLGIQSPISHDLSIALGSSGVSLLEIVNAYSVFANLGYRIPPIFIKKIVDRDGNVLEENHPITEKVIDQTTAYIMTHLLEGVVKHGTGWRVRALKRPVAGKTGTTNNLFDAWFVGYTPRYITGVWVGFDQARSLGKGETGSRAASPVWLGFMKRVLEDKPVRIFHVPDGVVFCKIDAKTGLLPNEDAEKTVFECFKEGTAPKEYTPKEDAVTEPENFFKYGM